MADVAEVRKKVGLLHRYPKDQIKQTNAAITYLTDIDILTFKKFDRLKNRTWKSLAWIFYAPYLVFGKKYDTIYIDDSFPFVPITVKLASPRSKIVLRIGDFHLMYYTSGLIYKILHEIEKIGWRCADRILAISDVMADKIESEIDSSISPFYIPGSQKKVYVVNDPVDPKDFPYRNGVKYNRVMFHGLLTKNKNVDVLLDAARLLPDVKFWVIGDGPDKERLQSIAPTNVCFKGWIPFEHMYWWISKCKIGVALRSNNPGNEYVVTSPYLQYGIMGKACIVTRRKVYEGYKWQFDTAEELADNIKILLDKPEEGEKLRKWILKYHNAKDIADDIRRHLIF